MSMFHEFAQMANSLIRNMHQAIFDRNTTAVLLDRQGRIDYIWRNIAALKEYILDISVDEIITEREPQAQCLMNAMTDDASVEEIHDIRAGQSMIVIGLPIHAQDGSVLGCLGFFAPLDTGNIGYMRGILKITADAMESKWKSREFQKDYESMYQKFLGILETVPLGTIITNRELEVEYVNEATIKIFAIEREEMLGRNIDDYLNADGLFRKTLESGKDIVDEDMVFSFRGNELKCEVLTTHLAGDARGGGGGLVIKLRNAKYVQKYKPSKNKMKARFKFDHIQGTSDELKEAVRLGKIASRSMSNVLLLGESGTGKELFAQAIHSHSLRQEGPFVAVNCGAMTSSLIESELFGYEAGAFTGASKEGKQGKFEQANGGTLFLDEIGDMPLPDQVSLLRVLQNKEVVRVGGNRTIKINVRIIAATNRDIEHLVREKKFRSDLYYRLNVFSINIPSLAERKEDIFLLADHFIRRYSVMLNKEMKGISEEVKTVFLNHSWPGNIRELENVIERAINVARSDVIQIQDLPQNMQTAKLRKAVDPDGQADSDLGRLQQMEKETIIQSLKHTNGNISKAAEEVGLGRRSMYRRLEKYRIHPEDYQQ